MKVVLVSCVKSKLPYRAKAVDLYTSPLFKGSVRYARSLSPDRIFILSANYGLLKLDDEIDPYEQTLVGQPKNVLQQWAAKVLNQLREVSSLESDHYVFLAGIAYRRYLIPHITSYEIPLEHKGFGQQLAFYSGLVP